MREPVCHLNGQWLPLGQATVPVLDRGFIFGDGVYEVIPAYGRRPFRLGDHLARLRRSLAAIALADPLAPAAWGALIERLLAENDPDDQALYIQVTRGVAPRNHAFPVGTPPTLFAYSSPFSPPGAQARAEGLAAVTLPDSRWTRAHIKSISLLGSVLARQAAADADAHEAILIRDGWLTEGSSSNVWVVRHGRLLCPPMDQFKLEGVRVGLLEALASAARVPLERRPVAEWELRCADEILLTSALREVIAVTRLDGRPVGSGRPGPVAATLYDAYQAAKRPD